MSKKIEKLLKDTYLANNVPESIHIPPLGENLTDVTKPIEQATLDDIAFAAQALDHQLLIPAVRRVAVAEVDVGEVDPGQRVGGCGHGAPCAGRQGQRC